MEDIIGPVRRTSKLGILGEVLTAEALAETAFGPQGGSDVFHQSFEARRAGGVEVAKPRGEFGFSVFKM